MTQHMPGLELDILIAKRVLGWYQEPDVGGPRSWWFSPDDSDSANAKELPKFSTDIKATWQLVERFKFCVVPFNKDYWMAFPTQAYHSTIKKYAATAPHAICLAALIQVGADVD